MKIIVAVIITACLGVTAGVELGWHTGYNAGTRNGPHSCTKPALPSGDAATIRGQEFICTDGTYVHVTGYGNP